MGDASTVKASLRSEMRALRRALPDRDERSVRLWSHVERLADVSRATSVMLFDSIPGEPETAPFVDWCRGRGMTVMFPEDDPPPDPSELDIVIVPGTAFTAAGDRLGQGGGWYDRFLSELRPDCVTIGVAFAPQIVDELPVEPHDIPVQVVVTERGVVAAR
ncbi:MAG: 5-formyltetrahydrofolate cyclo-ligase [Ilumatobacter sp.]|nr:5-formyltetrahydrofolate cyclo-ligase [Ilumatobacter sp.]